MSVSSGRWPAESACVSVRSLDLLPVRRTRRRRPVRAAHREPVIPSGCWSPDDPEADGRRVAFQAWLSKYSVPEAACAKARRRRTGGARRCRRPLCEQTTERQTRTRLSRRSRLPACRGGALQTRLRHRRRTRLVPALAPLVSLRGGPRRSPPEERGRSLWPDGSPYPSLARGRRSG